MKDYFTCVQIEKSPFGITYSDDILFLGSCFSDNISEIMSDYKFRVGASPFGTLYNPASIAAACRRLLDATPFDGSDLFHRDGLYHSFMHHSKFSDTSEAGCLAKINDALLDLGGFSRVSRLVITLGTAFIYRLKTNGRVVANCHKLPESYFYRERLTVNQITGEWTDLLEELWRRNDSLKVIFTVSPIRHFKDGAHQNAVSKAILLLAEQELAERYPGRISYFPAYELVTDELRDYRFYAEDMIHPSAVAVKHIWERFCYAYFDLSVRNLMEKAEKINKALAHKPSNPSSSNYKLFLKHTLSEIRRLHNSNPLVCFHKEEEETLARLQQLND
ncbi:MAG: GSCFA domain-containing protein [Tannerella sp.]|jgi:hypothetical protein|nr:GSCFA domain-containing protein [Tannerella sp.]